MNPLRRMHDDEIDIEPRVVHQLVEQQFPQWRDLPIARVESDGTENAIFRLGDELALRLPRHPRAVAPLEKELRWLPEFAPRLPVPVPRPVARGAPNDEFPFTWAIVTWVTGTRATPDRVDDERALATDLAAFVQALRAIDATDAPAPNKENYGRGAPLASRDARTRDCITELGDSIDAPGVTAAWDAGLQASVWAGAPTWMHGDLSPGNVLVHEGRLSGVIDFGAAGAGDPACELAVAWMLFGDEARAAFRDALDIDDDTWTRARAWALSIALFYVPYYLESNPSGCERARRVIDATVDDFRRAHPRASASPRRRSR